MALCSFENQDQSTVEQKASEQNSSSDEGSYKQQGGNAGWADSIAKVLSTTKPKTKRTLVLSRAKKIISNVKNKEEPNYGFEVDGEIIQEKPVKEELINIKQIKNQKLGLRVKPSRKDVERERTLRKIATRGVVQLFNAVRLQQKDLQQQLEEAGSLDSRKEAVLNNINKRKFLDVLMSGKRSKSEKVDNPVKNEFANENESSEDEANDMGKKSEWSVLRNDFMTNKKIKHWDEENASQSEQSEEEED